MASSGSAARFTRGFFGAQVVAMTTTAAATSATGTPPSQLLVHRWLLTGSQAGSYNGSHAGSHAGTPSLGTAAPLQHVTGESG